MNAAIHLHQRPVPAFDADLLGRLLDRPVLGVAQAREDFGLAFGLPFGLAFGFGLGAGSGIDSVSSFSSAIRLPSA